MRQFHKITPDRVFYFHYHPEDKLPKKIPGVKAATTAVMIKGGKCYVGVSCCKACFEGTGKRPDVFRLPRDMKGEAKLNLISDMSRHVLELIGRTPKNDKGSSTSVHRTVGYESGYLLVESGK